MNRLVLIALGVVVSVSAGTISYALDADLRAAQRGESTLVCTMKDGARVIAPARIVGRIDGTWIFSNGQARNCEVIKGGES